MENSHKYFAINSSVEVSRDSHTSSAKLVAFGAETEGTSYDTGVTVHTIYPDAFSAE